MSTMYVNKVQELNVGSGVQIPGHVIQTVTHENPNIGQRVQFNTSTPVEINTAYRISITPKAVGNKIILHYQYHTHNTGGVYGGIYPVVSTNGGSSWLTAVAEQDSASGYAKGQAPSDNVFQETHRNSYDSSGTIWDVRHQQAIWEVTTTNTHIFTLFGDMGSGTFAIGDNGPNVTAIAQEIAG